MEHIIALYLREIWYKVAWIFEGQHRFRPRFSCVSHVIMVCQGTADSLDNGGMIAAIIMFPMISCLENCSLMVHPRVVAWIREFLLGCTQRVRVWGQLLEEVRVASGVLQGSVLGPLLFLLYVNDIWKNNESTIRLFTCNCIILSRIPRMCVVVWLNNSTWVRIGYRIYSLWRSIAAADYNYWLLTQQLN
jgi:hypothetical protein